MRAAREGSNALQPRRRATLLQLALRQFASPLVLNSAWFVVSLLTELVVVLLLLRTRRPLWRSRPSAMLVGRHRGAMAALAVALPYVPPAARWFGFVPLGGALLATMLALVVTYALATEGVKRLFTARAGRAERAVRAARP